MKNKISFVFPSRKRPKKAISCIENVLKKAKNPENIEIVFVFDNDDVDSVKEILSHEIVKSNNVKYIMVDRDQQNFGELYNIGFRETTHDIIGIIADDVVVETDLWDEHIFQAVSRIPDEIYILAPDDGRNVMATHFITSRKVIEIMKFLQPPWFVADFGDMWFTEVFSSIQRVFALPNVKFTHMHYTHGSCEKDETYEDASERRKGVPNFNSPDHPYKKYGYVRQQQIEDLQKIIKKGDIDAQG